MKVDWLFKNVTVIDGSGGPQYRGDVAVKGDRIVDIAPALNVAADREIDGEGRVLAPGFIDVHTHDDINVIRIPEYLPKLSQGVTTVIVGNCGISAAMATMRGDVPDPMNLLGEQAQFIYPTVEAYAHAVEAARPSLNVGTLIGHTALRNNHMDDLFRPATESEIAGMRVQLRDALRQGALGLSTGLAYASAFQSTTEEVMALAEELAAEAFGAASAYLMVGGTTSAVQSMILSVVKAGDKIILPRNVHKSVINALVLCGGIPIYVNPEMNQRLGISLGMQVEKVKQAIEDNPDAVAVFVNNPTYYGICSQTF